LIDIILLSLITLSHRTETDRTIYLPHPTLYAPQYHTPAVGTNQTHANRCSGHPARQHHSSEPKKMQVRGKPRTHRKYCSA